MNLFGSKARLKGKLVRYFQILKSDHKDHTSEIKRVSVIAEKMGLGHNDLKKILEEADRQIMVIPVNPAKKFRELYSFIKFISKMQENNSEFDLCLEMAIIIGYGRYDAPGIVREIYNGLINEASEKLIKERVKSLVKKPRINFNSLE